jgi:hypothetical protein
VTRIAMRYARYISVAMTAFAFMMTVCKNTPILR